MQNFLDQAEIARILGAYGYLAIFAALLLECAGLPLPGETVLIGAAIYASQSPALSIGGVVAAAAAGAILGDNLGFWVGRRFGARALDRYAARLGFSADRVLLLRYLMSRFGGWLVFFGRFVTILRVFAAPFAGASRMPLARFLVFNAAGGLLWSAAIGFGAYYFTQAFTQAEGALARIAFLALIAGLFYLRSYLKRHEQRLLAEAKAQSEI